MVYKKDHTGDKTTEIKLGRYRGNVLEAYEVITDDLKSKLSVTLNGKDANDPSVGAEWDINADGNIQVSLRRVVTGGVIKYPEVVKATTGNYEVKLKDAELASKYNEITKDYTDKTKVSPSAVLKVTDSQATMTTKTIEPNVTNVGTYGDAIKQAFDFIYGDSTLSKDDKNDRINIIEINASNIKDPLLGNDSISGKTTIFVNTILLQYMVPDTSEYVTFKVTVNRAITIN